MDKTKWNHAVSFHGHECPGLAIGFRAALMAIDKLKIASAKDEELICITENDACGVDAIQALLGCTFGKGNLTYKDTGKHAYTFARRDNGSGIRLCLKMRKPSDSSREEWLNTLLTAKADDIYSVSYPDIKLPEKARIFRTLNCDICGEGAPEHKMRLQDGQTVCLDCFRSYSRGWR